MGLGLGSLRIQEVDGLYHQSLEHHVSQVNFALSFLELPLQPLWLVFDDFPAQQRRQLLFAELSKKLLVELVLDHEVFPGERACLHNRHSEQVVLRQLKHLFQGETLSRL